MCILSRSKLNCVVTKYLKHLNFNDLKSQEELFIKMVLNAWDDHVKKMNNLFTSLSDEQFMTEIAPGRNRGIYLLGHMAAVHDRMLPLLGLGEQLNVDMYKIFVEKPDKFIVQLPAIADLKDYWTNVNTTLSNYFSNLTPAEWFQKHNSVSEEDFANEPYRNKLNVIINRTNHIASHLGQLTYLMPKEE